MLAYPYLLNTKSVYLTNLHDDKIKSQQPCKLKVACKPENKENCAKTAAMRHRADATVTLSKEKRCQSSTRESAAANTWPKLKTLQRRTIMSSTYRKNERPDNTVGNDARQVTPRLPSAQDSILIHIHKETPRKRSGRMRENSATML